MSHQATPDVLVAGAGVIGCALALQLAWRGARVEVVEPGTPGGEASWAAGGMLSPLGEARETGPFLELASGSLDRYPAWIERVREASSVPVEYRREGKLEVALDEQAEAELRGAYGWRSADGARVSWLQAAEARRLEPALGQAVRAAVLLEDDHVVDSRALTRALWVAGERAGVRFRLGERVAAVARAHGGARGVVLGSGEERPAGAVLVAAGCWSPQLGGLPAPLPVFPVRGQMLAAGVVPCPLRRVVMAPRRAYLVPRADGRVVVGSTMERAGFRKETTLAGIRGLIEGAVAVVPGLADATLVDTWAGLRPGTPDDLPILGADPELPGLWYATGHFRNGILLAPITAELLAAALTGEAPALALAPFSPARFRGGAREV